MLNYLSALRGRRHGLLILCCLTHLLLAVMSLIMSYYRAEYQGIVFTWPKQRKSILDQAGGNQAKIGVLFGALTLMILIGLMMQLIKYII